MPIDNYVELRWASELNLLIYDICK
jgi:hypothetical protein